MSRPIRWGISRLLLVLLGLACLIKAMVEWRLSSTNHDLMGHSLISGLMGTSLIGGSISQRKPFTIVHVCWAVFVFVEVFVKRLLVF
ncbi:hypothetical protein [Deinococcus rubellus]|uniref:hypothetical protein n=1 Tax=Deinococcus rubellus TaxID=1889240 RepID=UPI0031EA9778